MSATFWNMRRRRAVNAAKQAARTIEQTKPAPEPDKKKGGGKNGK